MSSIEDTNIREIVARFKNSAEVIEELKGRLQSLATTDDLNNKSLESSQAATEALQSIGTEMREATEVLRKTLTTAEAALITATEFLGAIDLSEVAHKLEDLTEVQKTSAEESNKRFKGMEETISEKMLDIQDRLDKTHRRIAELTAERDEASAAATFNLHRFEELTQRVEELTPRVRKKFRI